MTTEIDKRLFAHGIAKRNGKYICPKCGEEISISPDNDYFYCLYCKFGGEIE